MKKLAFRDLRTNLSFTIVNVYGAIKVSWCCKTKINYAKFSTKKIQFTHYKHARHTFWKVQLVYLKVQHAK
jgi:hypothetical protein